MNKKIELLIIIIQYREMETILEIDAIVNENLEEEIYIIPKKNTKKMLDR